VVLATFGVAAAKVGCDALVEPAAGRSSGWHLDCVGRQDLAQGGLQPWRRETFKFSTDPEREATVRDIVGCICTRRTRRWCSRSTRILEIQALDRTTPMRPRRPGLPEKATHDSVRHNHHDHMVRGTGDRDRQSHRRLLPAASPRRTRRVGTLWAADAAT
jgi:hypothetical protein